MKIPHKQTVFVIGGPTASGKSGLALALAERVNGAVINGDSMQIYRGLPMLTAQPSSEDCSIVPHRLYNSLSPDDICSAGLWRDMALDEIAEVQALGKTPVIVGGTGFYLKSLLKGLSPIPDVEPQVRARLIALQIEMGNPAFHAEFAKLDKRMADKLDPFNTQRVVRAWEVLEGTGKSLAEWQDEPPIAPPPHLHFVMVALLPDREKLYQRCNRRFDLMVKDNVLDEVTAFRKTCPAGAPLEKALGYPELCAFVDGKISLPEAVSLAQQSTRNYAKRQVTWFRNQIEADIVLDTPDVEAVIARTSAISF